MVITEPYSFGQVHNNRTVIQLPNVISIHLDNDMTMVLPQYIRYKTKIFEHII